MEVLKPGGFGLFVLPQNFLLTQIALLECELISQKMRGFIASADLSAVPIFGDVGVYVILLVFQKPSA